MPNALTYNTESKNKLKIGMDKLANAVKSTLGPRGKYVIIQKAKKTPIVTNDGVTIAKHISLEDPFENIGAQLIKEISSKTNDIAGDGTTTACVLAQALINAGYIMLNLGKSPNDIIFEIEKITNNVLEHISQSVKLINLNSKTALKELTDIATISSGDETIGKIVGDAVFKVGKDGVFSIEDGKSTEIKVEITQGMQFDKGMESLYFSTDEIRSQCVLENPYILILNRPAQYLQEFIDLLGKISNTNRPFLMIADEVEGEVLPTLVFNKMKGILRCCGVRSPGFGEYRKEALRDIAIITGGKVIDYESDIQIKNVSLDMLGQAEKVIVTTDKTTIIGGKGKTQDIKNRIDHLTQKLEQSELEHEQRILRQRIAKINSGIVVIRSGGQTESEMIAKKYKIEDAVHAAQAAVKDGIVPGGGIALLKSSLKIDGSHPIIEALQEPFNTILLNSSFTENQINEFKMSLAKNEEYSLGVDINTGLICDMYDFGIVDPFLVTKSALKNAVSIVKLLLNTEVLITDIPEKKTELTVVPPSA